MALERIGRYEIQRRLSTGGMGALYLARDPRLDRLVAIKLLKDDYQDDNDLRERFAREARAVARLRHPNIIVVFDVGEDEGRPFMAMEYIAGETLTNVLRQNPPLPLVRRLGLVEDLCAGLAHAHGAGIVHRDVKPANIMLDGEGVLKILDFGIARLGNSGMTQDGMMMGSINYMSPEQIVGRSIDHRCDAFATGAVLYEAIALEQAFPGGFDSGVLHSILEKGPVPLQQRVPDVDPELAGIVQRALARAPDERYQDVNVMRRDIARVRRRLLQENSESAEPQHDQTIIASPRRGTTSRQLDPERLLGVRQQQVEQHLRLGREALAQGDDNAALLHAERAVTVDPDNPVAFDLIDPARFATEARITRELLAESTRLLAQGELDDASALAKKAAAAFPDLEDADELRKEVQRASDEITAARGRRDRIDSSLLRARTSLEDGGYETALRAVYEVLALDPERPEARELEQIAKSRLQTQRGHEQARLQAKAANEVIAAEAAQPALEQAATRIDSRAAENQPAAHVERNAVIRRFNVAYLAAAACVVVGVVVAALFLRSPAGASRQPSTLDPRPLTPVSGSGSITPTHDGAPNAEAATKVQTDKALEEGIAADRLRARQLLARGQLPQALSVIQSILRVRSDDGETRALLDAIASDASTAMRRAKEDAANSGAPTAASRTYVAAAEKESAAERSRLAIQIDRAVPLYWSARDQFAAAAREARQVVQAREQPPQEPAAGVGRIDPPSPLAVVPPARNDLPPRVDERVAIEQTLRAYEAAWASLDVEAVRRVQQFSGAELARVRGSLDAAREFHVSVQVQNVALAPDERHATVTARVSRLFTPKSGGKPVDNSTINTFTMEKRDNSWVIVTLR